MPSFKPAQRVDQLLVDQGPTPEQGKVVCTADGGVFEVQVLSVPATASATQGDYFIYENAAGDDVAVWVDIDADGTEPNGAQYVAATTKVQVDIVTGGTAAQNAALVKTAIDASGADDVTVLDNSNGTLRLTQDLLGPTANIVVSNEAENAAGSFSGSVTASGALSQHQSTYITFRSGSNAEFYAWLNVNGEGVDPAPGGTGIEVAVSGAATAAQVATALAAAVDADSNFAAITSGSTAIITNSASGDAVDIGAGDSEFSVATSVEGRSQGYSPGGNYGASAVEPSLFSVS